MQDRSGVGPAIKIVIFIMLANHQHAVLHSALTSADAAIDRKSNQGSIAAVVLIGLLTGRRAQTKT